MPGGVCIEASSTLTEKTMEAVTRVAVDRFRPFGNEESEPSSARAFSELLKETASARMLAHQALELCVSALAPLTLEFRAREWSRSPGIKNCEAPQSRQTRTLGKTKVTGLSRFSRPLRWRATSPSNVCTWLAPQQLQWLSCSVGDSRNTSAPPNGRYGRLRPTERGLGEGSSAADYARPSKWLVC